MMSFTSSAPATTSRVFVRYFFAISILLVGLVFLYVHGNLTGTRGTLISNKNIAMQDNAKFSWDLVTPAKELHWQKCFPGYQCARLIVPLNYSDPHGKEAIIALIRKPSMLDKSSPGYKGPILINPGGPGESGVEFVYELGDLLSLIVGPQFDIVGFDPRGVGQSTPRVAFFNSAAERAILYASDIHVAEDDVAKRLAHAVLLGKLAEDHDDGYLKHINTDHTARDMLRIVEAHGRTKIQYWGFSYGSVLGAVFASMFPDNIERLVIDGVVDSENYFATLWSNNLRDADKTIESFYTGCADAGPDRCAFWAPSPDDIRQNLTNLYDSITVQPVPVKTGNTYGYVDYKMLHSSVFQSLHSQYASYRHIAQGLADLASGNGAIILKETILSPFKCSGDASKGLERNLLEAFIAIHCNDGLDIPADLHSTQKHFEMMSNVSEFGTLWAAFRVQCAGWPKFPKNHFRGPFEANTSHPILLIGNTADPVTPLWAANKMSHGFNNSVVLTQNSSGHCSISVPSLCTAKYVRQYFADGKLPEPGTMCEADLGPFDFFIDSKRRSVEDAQGKLHMDMSLNEEDKQLLSAIRDISISQISRFFPSFSMYDLDARMF